MKLTKTWLRSFVLDNSVSDSTKVTLLTAILNSSEDDCIQIRKSKLSELRGINEHFVTVGILGAADIGWFVPSEQGTTRVVGTLGMPEKRAIAERKRKLTFEGEPAFEDRPVREWRATDFAEFFRCEWEKKHGGTLATSPAKLRRGIIKDGVQKLAAMDITKTHPKIRFRQYIQWAVRKFDMKRESVLRDPKTMLWFVEQDERKKMVGK